MQLTAKIFNRLAVFACLLLGLAVGPALAQQPSAEQTSAIRASCRSDFMANCSGVQPGGQEALECLKRNVAKLSGSCKTAVSAIMPVPAAAAPPPPPAAAATPPAAAAPPAPPPQAAPAPAHAAVPPPPAHAAAPPPPAAAAAREPTEAQTSAIRSNCRSDFTAHCPGVTPGGKDALACLQRSVAALSPGCKAAVAATMPAPAAAAHSVEAPAAAAPPTPAVAPLTLRPILPQRRMVIMAICHVDAERLCSGVPPIGPGVLDCLAAKAASLSPNCYDALARISRE